MFRQPPRQQRAMQRNQQQQLANLPEVGEMGSIILRQAKQIAVRHKYITAWYLMGIIILGLLMINGGGRALTPRETRQYNEIMNSINLEAEYKATENYWASYNRYRATKGWFWSCDSLCQRNKRAMQEDERRLNAIRAEGNARMSDAKSVAGLTSDVAVNEITDSFWSYFSAGKRFAKRQTGWDIVMMGIRSIGRGRDESWAEYALKVLLHILINFTMGLLSALVFFVLGLWNILRSYRPNPVAAVVIFLAAASAATAFVFSYLLALGGAAFAGVYGTAKLAETSNRQRIANQQRQERLHYE